MVRVWSAVDGKLEREFSGGGEDLYSLACHPDGETVVVGDLKGAIHRYGLRDGARMQSFDAGEFYKLSYIQDVGGVRTLAFSADGAVLAAGGCIPENGGFVQGIPGLRLFSTADGSLLQALRLGDNQDGFLHQVMAHPAGYWMGVCSGQPGKGKVFLHRQGEEVPFCVNKEALANCHSLALHPGGKEIAVAANAGTYGQQKSMAREGNYPGNTSPIHVLGVNGEW
jgi:WD40 repeat protein